MRHHIAACGVALAAAALVFAGGSSTASAAIPQTAQAGAALRYLYAQVGADGSIAASMGATEDTVIAVADNGYDPATLRNASSGASAYGYLAAHASAVSTAGGAAKYVLAWLAAGRPATIPARPLLTRLNTPVRAGGFLNPNGTFHDPSAAVETANAYSQSLAVLADLAAGVSLPRHAAGWLVCAQRPDGGFGYAIDDGTPAPPALCGDTSSDTNDTGIVLQALGRAAVTSVDSTALGYLHSAQQPDAGFGFTAAGPSDPDSDAVVIQALVATGQDPTASFWTVGTANPVTDMESFAAPSGGYVFPGNTTADAFTTAPVPQALALDPYGAATSVVPGSSPPPPPPPPSPSPRPSPTPAATAAASPSPTVPVPATGEGTAIPVPLLLVALGGLGVAAAAVGRRARPSP